MERLIFKFVLVIYIISALFTVASITASAASSGTCGSNLTWELDDNGTLTICGTGDMSSYYTNKKAPWYYGFVNTVKIEDGVTSIGGYAFYECEALKSVTIPNSVTKIGKFAFYSCTSLEELNWNAKKVTDFSSDNHIFTQAGEYGSGIKVTFGDDVETIPMNIFHPISSGDHSPKISDVSIGKGLKSISPYAFYGCYGFTSVTIPDNVTSIGECAFGHCYDIKYITIPDSVTSIGIAAFKSCKSLEKITLPFIGSSREANGSYKALFGYIFGNEHGEKINQYYSATGYSTYAIPSSLKSVVITDADIIPYGAFYGCNILDNITLNNGITAIYPNAFYNCSNLVNIIIMSQSIKMPNTNIFTGCDMLTVHGIEHSDIEEYAVKYEISFEPINDSVIGVTTLTTSAEVIEGNIVITAKANGTTSKKFIPVAVYDKNNVMLDLIIIPTNEDFKVIKIAFKDIKDAAFVKIFMWSSYNDLAPLDTAKKVNIVRNEL